MIEEDAATNKFYKKQKQKHDWKAGRKFIAFLLCLIAIIVLGILEKGLTCLPYIIGLFTAYVTGNVVQKATEKKDDRRQS